MDDPSWPEEYFSHSHGEAKASYPRWTKAESELTCHIQACADLVVITCVESYHRCTSSSTEAKLSDSRQHLRVSAAITG